MLVDYRLNYNSLKSHALTAIISVSAFAGIVVSAANAQTATPDTAAGLAGLTCCCCCPLVVIVVAAIILIGIIYRLFTPPKTVVTVNADSSSSSTAGPAPARVVCPNCGAPTDVSYNNCPQCGTKLKP